MKQVPGTEAGTGTMTNNQKNKTQLWQVGLIIFILVGLINSVLIRAGIGGILRELVRLTVLAGLILFAIGLIKRSRKSR